MFEATLLTAEDVERMTVDGGWVGVHPAEALVFLF